MSKSGDNEVSRVSTSGNRVANTAKAVKAGFQCCGCWVTGNAMSLLSAAFLFALITCIQYFYAIIANSVALKADCVSMAVDSLAFLGNLFAECVSDKDKNRKRIIQLIMSGISHFLLLGFTVYFIFDAIGNLSATDSDAVNGWIVFGFAMGGLLFDGISLLVYYCFGERSAPVEEDSSLNPDLEGLEKSSDALTCGINTNMCAALLHVLSDLGRSTTTLAESLVILFVPGMAAKSNRADGISALIICTMIVIGSVSAICVWIREVYIFIRTYEPNPTADDADTPPAYQALGGAE